MICSIQTIIFVVLLCGACGACGADLTQLNDLVKNLHAERENDDFRGNDPAVFACIYEKSMTEFAVAKSNNKIRMSMMIDKLSNGRDLSLFFVGSGNNVTEKDSRFKISKEWYIKSGTNICYIAYAFEKYKATVMNAYFYLKKVYTTKRIEFVAKTAYDFVLNIRNKCLKSKAKGCIQHMSQITVIGYSLGAIIAPYFCRHIFEETGQKAKKFIGLDPAAIYWANANDYIKSGDADYVQVVHTSYLGTQLQRGDSDIYIKSDNWDTQMSHKLAVDLHELISAKKLVLIAAENGTGRSINLQESLHVNPDLIQIADTECMVGVYCEGCNKRKHGQIYNISLVTKSLKTYF
ncbi:phospholipase A1-like isoform X2 [Contarinia nasturtii]|nr:phospholipase A1-like isoform X2 [Contarinia nasturtii]